MKKTNKNYQRLSIFFLMILGMFIVSCKNPLNLKHNSKDAKKAYIRISTNLYDSKVRSALPESFYDSKENDTKPGLIWELGGEESKGSEYEKIWEDDSTTNNTAYKQMLGDTSIELDVGTWTFTLTAYVKNSDNIQEKVLESTIQKTIVSGQNSLSFEMEEAVGDEGVANGEISFTLNFPQNQIHNLAITLYKYPAQEGKYFPLDNQANQEISNEVSSYTYEYSNIEPGNYLLEIALQQETGLNPEDKTPIYETINTYTCVIHVAPGLKSVGSFKLTNLAKLYQISYKYIDGETEVEAQFDETVTTSYNKYQTFTLPTPKRDGYTFKGWYTDEETKVTSYKIPDDFDGTEIVFYADWEEVVVEQFTLKKQSATGQELVLAENEKVEKETGYTRIIINKDDSNNVWTYFVSPENNEKFKTDGNYFVSVDLWSSEDTVVAVAASRADMFFTVDGNSDGEDKWTHCEFETGFVKAGINNTGLTFGVGLSSEIRIKNLKVERISDTSNLPTLSFNISDEGIKNYLAEENKADQIIFVEKSENEDNSINGYKINLNAKGVTLKLRNYATPGKINNASFKLITDESFSFLPSITGYSVKTDLYETDNKNEAKINYWSNPSTVKENNNICFPAFKNLSEDTIVPCVIDGLFNAGTESTGSITITDFEIKPVDNLENTDKVFAVKVGNNWSKPLSLPYNISEISNNTEVQVVLTDKLNTEGVDWTVLNWGGEDKSGTGIPNSFYCQFTNYQSAEGSGISVSNGDSSCTITNTNGAEKIKLSLADDFTVLIEEVTDTNNDQPSSGGTGGDENQGGELGLVYDNTDSGQGKLLIYNETGLENYRKIVNGETVQVPAKDGNWNQQVSYQLPAYLEADIEIDGEWTPIGDSQDHKLIKNFDGKGHTITFKESSSFTGNCVGVFGYAGNYTEPNTISNLVVKGTLTSSSSTVDYVGGIVAYGVGINIENCINMASLCSGEYVGGIIGYVCNATENNVSKCINARPINSSRYVGGIVAYTLGDMEISDCMNLKDLQSAGTGFGTGIVYVGGNSSPTVNVKNCLNVGYVNLYEKYAISAYACSVTESYYDSSKWIRDNLQGGTFTQTPEDEDTAIAKTTEDLTNGNKLTGFSEDNWSFAADESRYPLPNVSETFSQFTGSDGKTVWQEIVEAATVEVSGGNGDEIVQNAYYVSAGGSDENVGSYTEPYNTLSKAITEASTSEHRTIYVIGELNGSSEGFSNSTTENDEKNSVFYISGNVTSADKPITICGYPDTNATLSAEDVNQEDSSSPARVFASAGSNYFVMENLIITGGNTQGSGGAILYYGGKLTLKNCTIKGNESLNSANSDSGIKYDGVYMYGTSELEMLDTDCYNSIYLYNSSATFSGGILGYYDQNALPIVHVENATVTLKKDVEVFNTIYVKGTTANICVAESLTVHSSSDGATISLKLNDYTITNQLISASEGVTLAEETQKFSLVDNSYIINTNGYVEKKN